MEYHQNVNLTRNEGYFGVALLASAIAFSGYNLFMRDFGSSRVQQPDTAPAVAPREHREFLELAAPATADFRAEHLQHNR